MVILVPPHLNYSTKWLLMLKEMSVAMFVCCFTGDQPLSCLHVDVVFIGKWKLWNLYQHRQIGCYQLIQVLFFSSFGQSAHQFTYLSSVFFYVVQMSMAADTNIQDGCVCALRCSSAIGVKLCGSFQLSWGGTLWYQLLFMTWIVFVVQCLSGFLFL